MGNAKLFNKLLDQTKSDAKTIADLRLQITRNNALCDQRIQGAIDAMAAQHKDELARLKTEHDEDWRIAEQRKDAQLRLMADLAEKNKKLEEELGSYKHEVGNLVMIKDFSERRIAELEAQLEAIKPELALLEAKREELTKLCDKVRDRMKRKELEEERAILNRKALAGAAPGPNRGR